MGEERDDLRPGRPGGCDDAPVRNAASRDHLRRVLVPDPFPIAGGVVLRSVWAKGWVVPDEPELPPLPVTEMTLPQPVTSEERAWRIARWTLGLVARARRAVLDGTFAGLRAGEFDRPGA